MGEVAVEKHSIKEGISEGTVLTIVLVVLLVMSLCFLGLCAWLRRKKRLAKKKKSLLEVGGKVNNAGHGLLASAPKGAGPEPWLTGVLAEQPIQFVVPASCGVGVCDTTEDSLSEPDTLRNDDRSRKRSSVNFFTSPETIEKALYKESGDKVQKKRSLLSGLGRVGFSLHYNVLRQQLCVRLIGASNLPSPFTKDTANPFAKVVLMPEKTPRFLSKVHRHTVNPSFNEVFVFPVKREQLSEKEIKISVYDQDKFNKKVLIGSVRYPLRDAGMERGVFEDANTGDIWTDLRLEVAEEKPGVGELFVSLSYNPESTTLTVVILKSRNVLTEAKISMLYVKVSLYVRKRLVRTRKTSTRKQQSSEVEFGDPFHIILPAGAIGDVDLIVTLCGKGRGGKRVLGRTQVGADSPMEHGVHHWQDMLESPKSTAAQWHPLGS